MRLMPAATAYPANSYPQQAITEALQEKWKDSLTNPGVKARLHSRCGVEQRHMVLKLPEYRRITGFGEANNIWIEAATRLGSQAVCRALRKADVALHSKPGNCPEWLFYCTQTPEFAVVTALKNRNKRIATKRDKVTFGI